MYVRMTTSCRRISNDPGNQSDYGSSSTEPLPLHAREERQLDAWEDDGGMVATQLLCSPRLRAMQSHTSWHASVAAKRWLRALRDAAPLRSTIARVAPHLDSCLWVLSKH